MTYDKNMVISSFEKWLDWLDDDVPIIGLDALELLKEQQNIIDELQKIVKCRECKHFTDENDPFGYGMCEVHERRFSQFWFCADGEKRE